MNEHTSFMYLLYKYVYMYMYMYGYALKVGLMNALGEVVVQGKKEQQINIITQFC